MSAWLSDPLGAAAQARKRAGNAVSARWEYMSTRPLSIASPRWISLCRIRDSRYVVGCWRGKSDNVEVGRLRDTTPVKRRG